MCGICGEYRLDGSMPDLNHIQAMMEKIEKRGPERGEIFTDDLLIFDYHRLSILDKSKTKVLRPLADSFLVWLVYY